MQLRDIAVLILMLTFAQLSLQGRPRKIYSDAVRKSARIEAQATLPSVGRHGPARGQTYNVDSSYLGPTYTHYAPRPVNTQYIHYAPRRKSDKAIEAELFSKPFVTPDTYLGKKRLKRNSDRKRKYLDSMLSKKPMPAQTRLHGTEDAEDGEEHAKLSQLLSYRFTDAKLARRFMIMLGLEDKSDDPFERVPLTREQAEEVDRHLKERRIGLGEFARDGRYFSRESRSSRQKLLAERENLIAKLHVSKGSDLAIRDAEIQELEQEITKDRRRWTNQRKHLTDRVIYEEQRDSHSLQLANALIEKANLCLSRNPAMTPAYKDIARLATLLASLPIGQRCPMVGGPGTSRRLEWAKKTHPAWRTRKAVKSPKTAQPTKSRASAEDSTTDSPEKSSRDDAL